MLEDINNEAIKKDDINIKKVLRFFEDITKIPRGTGNTKQISDYIVEFAKERNLTYFQDDYNNVIIIKEATRSDLTDGFKSIMLQGHIDMVAVKDKDLDKDMTKEGMEGAINIDMSSLKSTCLINVDSEDQGIMTVGCAGGETITANIKMEKVEVLDSDIALEVMISNLKGGHSGCDIHLTRANADYAMIKMLEKLSDEADIKVVKIAGGDKSNAIATDASCIFIVNEDEIDKAKSIVENEIKRVEEIFNAEEDMMIYTYRTINLKDITLDNDNKCYVLPNESVKYLALIPNGVTRKNMTLNMVETSLNLGIVRTTKENDNSIIVTLVYALRSNIDEALVVLDAKVKDLLKKAKASFTLSGEYPAWPYMEKSKLAEIANKYYEEMFGTKMKVETIHAGLECGILNKKVESLDAISIGPDVFGAHTTSERVRIKSLVEVFDYLVYMLEKI